MAKCCWSVGPGRVLLLCLVSGGASLCKSVTNRPSDILKSGTSIATVWTLLWGHETLPLCPYIVGRRVTQNLWGVLSKLYSKFVFPFILLKSISHPKISAFPCHLFIRDPLCKSLKIEEIPRSLSPRLPRLKTLHRDTTHGTVPVFEASFLKERMPLEGHLIALNMWLQLWHTCLSPSLTIQDGQNQRHDYACRVRNVWP